MRDSLGQIKDRSSAENIEELTRCFVKQLNPMKVFLFGSFADGSYNDDSDYDFYIVISDDENVGEASDQAYKAIRFVQQRPVDIVIGTASRFDRVGHSVGTLQIEGEVARKGILLYDRNQIQMEDQSTDHSTEIRKGAENGAEGKINIRKKFKEVVACRMEAVIIGLVTYLITFAEILLECRPAQCF